MDAASSHSSRWICGNNCEASMIVWLKLLSPQKFALHHIDPTPQMPPPSGHNWLKIQNFLSLSPFFFLFFLHFQLNGQSEFSALQHSWNIRATKMMQVSDTFLHTSDLYLSAILHYDASRNPHAVWHGLRTLFVHLTQTVTQPQHHKDRFFSVSGLWWRHRMTLFTKSSPKWCKIA